MDEYINDESSSASDEAERFSMIGSVDEEALPSAKMRGKQKVRQYLPSRWDVMASAMTLLCIVTLEMSLAAAAAAPSLWPAGLHSCFDTREATVQPPRSLKSISPPILYPGMEGSFAKYTLTKRLPAVVERIIKEDAVGAEERKALEALASEIPDVHLRRPTEITAEGLQCEPREAELFNGEWAQWTDQRSKGGWTDALPLISTEMYFYRRILDCTGFFSAGPNRLADPYESQKAESLVSALGCSAFLSTVAQLITADRGQSGEHVAALLRKFVLADLWGNQGDLALAPNDTENTDVARTISHDDSQANLLQDESQAAIEHIMASPPGRIDMILDNSGIELLCDLVLADFLITQKLANQVCLHVKGEPLFISDSMHKDVASHIAALTAHSDPNARALAVNLAGHRSKGTLVVKSHMFWTAPRLFWEMPQSLAEDLSSAALVIVKGDANYRRLVGDRVWPTSTPLADVVGPWFPAPLLVLRTLKAEIALGLTKEQTEVALAKDKDWMVNGKWAQICFWAPSRIISSGAP